jgi:CRISPR-associated protein Cas5d
VRAIALTFFYDGVLSNMKKPPDEFPPLEVKLWGKMALFTRPESKAERVSYPVMTPSAARGALEAIYWKPEFHYRIREIVVLAPIRFASLLRNEVESKMSDRSEGISITEVRQQRHSLVLRGLEGSDLAYLVRADVVPNPGVTEDAAKYRDIFRRRVKEGQYFHHPYFGCREFTCDFAPPDGKEQADPSLRETTLDLGLMLFDIAFGKSPNGPAIPLFFEAKLENGVLRVPDSEYERREALRL